MYELRGHSVKNEKRRRGPIVLKSAIPFFTQSVSSLINRAVDVLPVELHLPGYRFCGPGTRPVSYTHLDVYKRQGFDCCDCFNYIDCIALVSIVSTVSIILIALFQL